MSGESDREIADLDAALAADGQWCVLRRKTGAQNQVINSVEVRAFVRSPRAEQLVGGITQSASFVVISPSEIAAAQWPGGQPPSAAAHPEIPRNGDWIVIAGKERKIDAVNPIFVDDVWVRANLTVLG